MTSRYCALPPVNQNATQVGRGYGMGAGRTSSAQRLHAGFDFQAGEGTPVIAPIDGVVSWKATEAAPRGTTGYGNMVALQHDLSLPGLPNPFFTSYNHLRDPSALAVGQRVRKGDLIGYVGRTNNRTFPGMPAHLHFEVRTRNYPSSYERSTIDPLVMWRGLGFDIPGSTIGTREQGRLLAVRGGPSDCGGPLSGLAGMGTFTCLGGPYCPCPMCAYRRGDLAAVPPSYKDPVEKTGAYDKYGASSAGAPVDEPPDYAAHEDSHAGGGASSSSSGAGLAVVGAAALFAVYALRSR